MDLPVPIGSQDSSSHKVCMSRTLSFVYFLLQYADDIYFTLNPPYSAVCILESMYMLTCYIRIYLYMGFIF